MASGPRRLILLITWVLNLTIATVAQSPPVSLTERPGSTAHTRTRAEAPQRQVSWKLFAPNILHDQKRICLFPEGLAQGKHWIPTAGFVLATAGLMALDAHEDPYFRRTQTFNQFNRVLSFNNTIAAMTLLPLSAYAVGLARRDSYTQQTVQLAAEAVLDAEIPALVTRDVSRRLPPRSIPRNGDFSDTWFRRNKGPFYLGPGGFPSGHTVAAFSIATVFAERYRRHRWVPWVAYGLAGLVGFSRVTMQAHFPSDVFAGAVLGYTVSHYVALRPP